MRLTPPNALQRAVAVAVAIGASRGRRRRTWVVSRMTAPTLQVLDESIYDMLDAVRERPGLFIGEPSMHRLHAIVLGVRGGALSAPPVELGPLAH
jgi:hypothetical protein